MHLDNIELPDEGRITIDFVNEGSSFRILVSSKLNVVNITEVLRMVLNLSFGQLKKLVDDINKSSCTCDTCELIRKRYEEARQEVKQSMMN